MRACHTEISERHDVTDTVAGVSRVGVVGCGQMGAGIAEVCARSGLEVKVAETTGEALEIGRTRLCNSLAKAAERGKISEEEHQATLERLSFTTDLGEFADRDLVIEAVVENEQVKSEIFQVLDQVVTSRDAILASNTSSIPLVKLAVATSRPDQVVGIHFFNPAPVQRLVELIPALTTSEETIKRSEAVVEQVLGKHAIRAQDRSGFVVNALLIPYLLSAIRMFESGIASREDIDNGMELGCAHPMGPLKLSDLIGLDTVASVADSMYAEFKEPLYAAPPLLQRMVDAGRLGRKTGSGFYTYS
ncbi:3-hydroxybutyryl-CoA dehydrogenase [Streptomyces sp. I6]|nr:3-hydroxybutyryl-CoA dehydrogenase [Streptomyces sp. I6]